jgi:hypothetical protein
MRDKIGKTEVANFLVGFCVPVFLRRGSKKTRSGGKR